MWRVSDHTAHRRHGTAIRGRLPGDAVPVGGGGRAIHPRARPGHPGPQATLAELIIGAMLARGGHVTRAILALTPRLGWQAYHWMIEHGRFRLLGLVAALCGIVRRETGGPRRFVIIDDTLAPRCSAKAPGAAVRFDHARKPNRPPSCCARPSSPSARSCPAATGRVAPPS